MRRRLASVILTIVVIAVAWAIASSVSVGWIHRPRTVVSSSGLRLRYSCAKPVRGQIGQRRRQYSHK